MSIELIDPNIYLNGNDKHEMFDLTTPSSTTGEDSAATGLSGLTVHYSLAKDGAAIHADLTASLTEYSETPGRYWTTMTGSAIATRLADYAGRRIFAVVKNGGVNVQGNGDRFVVASRPI